MDTKRTIPVQVNLSLKNAALIQARKDKGLRQQDVAKMAGVGQQCVSRFERFQYRRNDMEYAERIASLLEIPLEDVYPPELREVVITANISRVEEVPIERLLCLSDSRKRFTLPSPVDVAMRKEQMQMVRGLLEANLSPRERDVIKSRFGIGDGDETRRPEVYREIGERHKVSKTRIQEIERDALRKLSRASDRLDTVNRVKEESRLNAEDELNEFVNRN
jgi:DNA-binding XRE family transcriptional regulator